MKTKIMFIVMLLSAAGWIFAAENLVYNGSFEIVKNGIPDGWTYAGNAAVKQKLSVDKGHDGGICARLDCTEFSGDGPDYHAMICQVNKVSVKRGEWYRLTFYARGIGIRGNAVDVGLNRTRQWENVGLSESFLVDAEWRRYEMLFQAKTDLPQDASRLQFWFKSTGTLWLDDVELKRTESTRQFFPQIPYDESGNFVPNSSFECGEAGWGSITYGLSGWAGNLYKLEGEIDSSTSFHGKNSLKISLNPQNLPVHYFDYFTPVRQPVKRVLAANLGWLRIKPGDQYTLSVYMKANAPDTKGELLVTDSANRNQRKTFNVDTVWKRFEFTFTPSQEFIFIAAGLNLEETRRDSATLWLDAVQLEKSKAATPYRTKSAVEAFVLTTSPHNISLDPSNGICAKLRAFNSSTETKPLSAKVTLTDFFDKTVYSTQIDLTLKPESAAEVVLNNVTGGKTGFFRIICSDGAFSNSIRAAVLPGSQENIDDSPFGFNHAYPWDFLIKLAHYAGVIWWRDWSAKWDTIEPEKNKTDFTIPDEQIIRVLKLRGKVDVLLPFPSARWSSSVDPAQVEKAAGNDEYLKARLPLAWMPRNIDDFATHASDVVKHYSKEVKPPVSYFEILNEPIYTSYALPRQFGYSLDDYLKLLKPTYSKMKSVNPDCKIIGGIGANLEAGLTLDFIRRGGLNYVDVFDIHNYDPPRSAESFEDSFKTLKDLMQSNGGVKPVWITEWGCYADDDPPFLPFIAGDSAMNRSRWQSERLATEHIVKYAAVGFAYGLRKIFFHAGTCGQINGQDAGGVLFEYGGTPRKMYPGVAIFTKIVGVPEVCSDVIRRDGALCYLFKCKDKFVGICWNTVGKQLSLKPQAETEFFDIMGNPVKEREYVLTGSPIYIQAKSPEQIRRIFE